MNASVWLASESENPAIQVVGVPSSRSSTAASQAALAPLELRTRLDRFSTFHADSATEFGHVGVEDKGNWAVSEIDPVPLVGGLMRMASALPKADLNLFLGGDNAITRPLVAAGRRSLSTVGLIRFDNRHDVDEMVMGPSNGNVVRGLVEEHGLDGRNVVQLGIGTFSNSASSRRFSNETGMTVVTAEQLGKIGVATAVEVAVNQLSATCETIHVDIDLGVLDAHSAPGCPGAMPGGMSVRDLAEGVARCASYRNVDAMSFVEVDPEHDHHHLTVDAMAHVLLSAVAGFAMREPA